MSQNNFLKSTFISNLLIMLSLLVDFGQLAASQLLIFNDLSNNAPSLSKFCERNIPFHLLIEGDWL